MDKVKFKKTEKDTKQTTDGWRGQTFKESNQGVPFEKQHGKCPSIEVRGREPPTILFNSLVDSND